MSFTNARLRLPCYAALSEDNWIRWKPRCRTSLDLGRRPVKNDVARRYAERSLKEYLQRHPELEQQCSKEGRLQFFTTEQPENFDGAAGLFFGREIKSEHLAL